MLSRDDIRKLAILGVIAAGIIGLLILSQADLRPPSWCDLHSTKCFDQLSEPLK
jgi:ABC-type phosphate/phosphonate transport system permease subunit